MNDYLEGYRMFALLKDKERWNAECAITSARVRWPELKVNDSLGWSEEKCRGWVDAALDSVGC